ncbi:FG-GAP and VCBS repeat-containing protein [Streptomyces sp. NPDC048603]|uniref:FG-GAP and VCBS repeat-containing protein n=1 Tax=Streptomyces sp. NPDC048603 TaxID=3365577 RepID=UPI00371D4E4B
MRTARRLTTAACTAAALAVIGTVPVAAAPAKATPATKATPSATTATTAQAAETGRTADFNGDGYPDLATAAPTAAVAGKERAGLVAVQYGSPTGLQKPLLLTKDTPGVPGLPTANGRFGVLVGQGDVDGDGFDDLLVDGGLEGRPEALHASGTLVLRGSKDGLTGRYTGLLTDGPFTTGGVRVLPKPLAVGDVTGDGIADIVAPAGRTVAYDGIAVLKGPFSPATNEPAAVQFHDTRALGVYSSSLIQVSDMTGDGIADVIVAQWGKGLLLKGSASGLTPAGEVSVGGASAFGDLNKDGYQDFVTGDGGAYNDTEGGRIRVYYGSATGISKTLKPATYTQDSPGVPGVNETGDRFGSALSVGDTDQDGYEDIVIGATYETGSDAAATWSGSVTVLRGSAAGVTTAGSKLITQDSAGVPSNSEKDDHFGSAVAVLDTDKDGKAEVYIGGYGEDAYKGRVWRLPTGTGGVTGTGSTSHSLTDLGGPAGRAHLGWGFGAGGNPPMQG